MGCEVEERDGLVRIRGEMTIYAAAALAGDLLRRAADAAAPCHIDLSEVSEIDTTGLQILLMARRARPVDAQPVQVLAASPTVLETLELLRLGDVVSR
jgi:anti-anti-sigma factor